MAAITGRVLITGATGGIGQAIARACAAQGCELVLTGRRTEVLEPLAAELSAQMVPADLSDRRSLASLVTAAGQVDVAVANAALPGTGRLVDLEQTEIDGVLEVNLGAQVALARALLPGMLARGRGHLVFIASLSGKVASPESTLYNTTKFGLRGFAFALREDLHGTGVSASVVSPGFVSDAGMFHDAGVDLPPGVGTVTPEQVAAGVLRAVRRDRAEICVAPAGLRLGAALGALTPGLSGFVQRHAGGARIARDLASGHMGSGRTAAGADRSAAGADSPSVGDS